MGTRSRENIRKSRGKSAQRSLKIAATHVVGIGGSAGSLEPLERFFRAVRRDSTMSFIVVTHRDPRSEGMMVEILSRFTPMAVREAVEGELLERGVVYVVPSSRHLALRDGHIALLARPAGVRVQTPIDSLFRAIADDRQDHGIGVVLSGMGSDGTLGLAAIKEKRGIILVQDPATAAYDAMPRSAIDAGLADVVAAPEVLAKRLDALPASTRVHPRSPKPDLDSSSADGAKSRIDTVLASVRAWTGHDFSQYKKSTLERRIQRRMNLRRVADVPGYVKLLEEDPEEIARLLSDLLIGVSQFFRDPEVFEVIARDVIPPLLERRSAEQPLRIWVAGCANGEEAYSLAMLLHEACDDRASRKVRAAPSASAVPSPLVNVQMYATDLDEGALRRARQGVFGPEIADHVSPERLERFFVREDVMIGPRRTEVTASTTPPTTKTDRKTASPLSDAHILGDSGSYRIKKSLRDMVVFAKHNLVSDPPFTKLDILCCRNVLIYLEPALQEKLLALFLYALNPGGYLVLGASEGIRGFEDGFKPVSSSRHGRKTSQTTSDDVKIFQRSDATHGLERPLDFLTGTTHAYGMKTASGARGRLPFTIAAPSDELAMRPRGARVASMMRASSALRLPDFIQRLVIEQLAPPVVVVDKKGDVLHASQRMTDYLELPVGKTSTNIFAMAREGLVVPLRSALRRALSTGEPVTEHRIRLVSKAKTPQKGHAEKRISTTFVELRVVPLPREGPRDAGKPSALIAFVEVADLPGNSSPAAKLEPGSKRSRGERVLEVELAGARLQLAEMLEEMTHSEAALNTVNEELQSTNEELQSANEELQSTNEELTTSKEEMQSMNEELLTLNAELQTTNEQLATTNDDMRNLLNSSQIPTLFLDNQLRLKRFTAQATRIARLLQSDVGRPITDITWSLRYEHLAIDVKSVLDTLVSIEREVETDDDATYTMRIHPYRTIDDVIDGVVITFMDISEPKRKAAVLRREECEKLLSRTISQWPAVAWVEDTRTKRSLVVSAATQQILGYPASLLARATEDFWRELRSEDRRGATARRNTPVSKNTTQDKTKRRDSTEIAGTSKDETSRELVHLRRHDGQVLAFRARTRPLTYDERGLVIHVLHHLALASEG